MSPALFLEQIINGLVLGSMYALVGSGIALIYGTMRVLNLAQGEFYMLGGYVAFFLIVGHSVSPFIAIPIAFSIYAVAALVMFRRGTWKTTNV